MSDHQVASDECGNRRDLVAHRNYFYPADPPANHSAYSAQHTNTSTKNLTTGYFKNSEIKTAINLTNL